MSSRTATPKTRAAELRKTLNSASAAYYTDEPIMTDAEFDRLYDELAALESEHPDLVAPDSPTQRVGAAPSERFRKVEHLAPMGSLEKVTSAETLAKFADDIRKRLGTEEAVAYLVEPKIDGLAVSLLYEKGTYARGATRGDGERGEDITPNLRTIKAVPLAIARARARPPDLLEVRGEVYMPLSGFRAFTEQQEAEGKRRRRTRATRLPGRFGSSTRRSPRTGRSRSGPTASGRSTESSSRASGRSSSGSGRTASARTRTRSALESIEEVAQCGERVGGAARRARLRDRRDRDQGGLARPAAPPRGAARSPALGARVQVGADVRPDEAPQKIHIRVGRTGALNPWAELEPVQVGGVTVSTATLHNEEDINRKDIREGDTVVVQRAGDVIPQVVGPVLPHPRGSKPFRMPAKCPLCAAES